MYGIVDKGIPDMYHCSECPQVANPAGGHHHTIAQTSGML